MTSPSRNRRACLEALESRSLRSATLLVTNTDDSGAGSLRDTVAAAAPGDTIDMTSFGWSYINLSSAIHIDKDLTLNGPAELPLYVGGNHYASRAFEIDAGVNVTMSNFTIAHVGSTESGGGILVGDPAGGGVRGSLTLDGMDMLDNRAVGAGGALAAYNTDVTLNHCQITANYITADGNGFANGGGVYVEGGTDHFLGTTFNSNGAAANASNANAYGGGMYLNAPESGSEITNCTFGENSATADGAFGATAYGGGLFAMADASDFDISNSTFYRNTLTATSNNFGSPANVEGGGLAVRVSNAGKNAMLTNCLIAQNGGGPNVGDVYLEGVPRVSTYNLVGDGTGSDLTDGVDHNQVGTSAQPIDPRLDDLMQNSGVYTKQTYLPLSGSPAINAGTAAGTPSTDARGLRRNGVTDVGAVEYNGLPPNRAPTVTSTDVNIGLTDGPYRYDVTTNDADGDPVSITIASTTFPWLSITDHGDGTATLAGVSNTPVFQTGTVNLLVDDGTAQTHHTFTVTMTGTYVPEPVRVAGGVLYVEGTAGADTLQVWQPKTDLTRVRVLRNGRRYDFSKALITAVHVDALAGDDTVVLNAAIPGEYAYGGAGNDTLTGGAGYDILSGGLGDDRIVGNGGNDRINGNGDRDTLMGNGGDDRLYGGNGRDLLDGGGGQDHLYGEAGSDLFLSRDDERDWLFGDDSDHGDSARADADDVVDHVAMLLA